MMIINDKIVYIHYPKTGGTFMRTILKKYADCKNVLGGHQSSDHFPLRDLPLEHQDKPVYATVRDPLSWYESAWKFLRDWTKSSKFGENSPNPLAPLEKHFNPNFNTFIINCLKHLPGYYSNSFSEYFSNSDIKPIWIQTEMLTYDLIYHMRFWEIEFDAKDIIKSQKHGAREAKIIWNPDLKSRIIDCDYKIYEKYYL